MVERSGDEQFRPNFTFERHALPEHEDDLHKVSFWSAVQP